MGKSHIWWLIESLQWLFLGFCPQNLEGARDLKMIFCWSLSTVWAVSSLIGSGDTETLTALIKFFTLFSHPYALLRSCTTHAPMSHQEKLSLLNIYYNDTKTRNGSFFIIIMVNSLLFDISLKEEDDLLADDLLIINLFPLLRQGIFMTQFLLFFALAPEPYCVKRGQRKSNMKEIL